MWALYIDGAARGNPGEAGIGIHITKAGHPYRQEAFYLGERTNNQAEYCALLIGLYMLRTIMDPNDTVTIYSDSQLLVKQIQGAYRVKKPWLQQLYQRAMTMLNDMSNYSIHHIQRSDNTDADKLANYAIDNYIPLPDELTHLCS